MLDVDDFCLMIGELYVQNRMKDMQIRELQKRITELEPAETGDGDEQSSG